MVPPIYSRIPELDRRSLIRAAGLSACGSPPSTTAAGYSPLGLVSGIDLPPDDGELLFADGFESGDASARSSSTG